MLNIEIFRILIALVGCGIAAYYDIFNKKNVPTSFLYSFLGISLFINIFDPQPFLENLPIAFLIVAVFYFSYRIGQIGGADVIVLAALYASLPIIRKPIIRTEEGIISNILNLKIPSILSILCIAAVLFILHIIIKYFPMLIKKIRDKKFTITQNAIIQIILLLVIYFLLFYTLIPFSSFLSISSFYFAFLIVLFFFLCFFILFKDEITSSMVRWKRKVEEEDIIALELLDKKTVEKFKLGRLVTAEQLNKMKKIKRKWPVLDLPQFIPYLFIACLLYILFGNPFTYLV